MKPSARAHFHFGLGKFALGLVVPFFNRHSSLRMVTLVRRESKTGHYDLLEAQRGYDLTYYDTNKTQKVGLLSIERYDGDSCLLKLADQYGLPAIISCSVGEGRVATLFPVIAALVRAHAEHYRDQALLFLPFENSSHAAVDLARYLAQIEPGLEKLVIPMNMIVDRICAGVRVDPPRCIVVAESFEEFYLSPVEWDWDPPSGMRSLLAESGLLGHYLDPPVFDLQKKKKTWVVNGLHYCISIL